MDRTALVISQDERVVPVLEAEGFVVTVAGTNALDLLRHEAWTVVVTDGLADAETDRYLKRLSGRRRRDLFVVVVAERFETGHRFQAWTESADLVMHPDEVGNIGMLIEDGLADKACYYRVFHRVFHRVDDDAVGRLGAHT